MPGLTGYLLGKPQKVSFIKKGENGSEDSTLVVDCSVSERHSREAIPSEFPIEGGDNISDNILIKPYVLELQGIKTDTPIKISQSVITTLATVALPPVGVVAAGFGYALANANDGTSSPSKTMYEQLLSLQDSKKPFSIVTGLKRYDNMWIKSISVPRDASTGRALVFDVSLIELNIVQAVVTNIQIFSNSGLASSQADLGKQQSKANALLKGFKDGQANIKNAVGGLAP